MTTPRSWQMPAGTMGTYHVISRCTRRLWLLHGEWAHRKDWFCELAGGLLECFRIDLHAYAVMANHVHMVLRPRPDRVTAMEAVAVAAAGHRAMPVRGGHGNVAMATTPELLQRLSSATEWQREYRQRLSSISWFMRCLKQRISQRANAETGCSGHFWDARFLSVPLPDLAAVVGCMAYVDANPYRAKAVAFPERATYTSLRARMYPDDIRDTPESILAARLTPLEQVGPVDPLSGRIDNCALGLEDYLGLIHVGCGLVPDSAGGATIVGLEGDAWRRRIGEPGMFQGAGSGRGPE
ncbi:MAG TPA: hypothetical protein DCS97_02710 [Planctomycetes bacterium]|nr:hypothetical protein [Planctomycetota bacterium]